MKHTNTPAYLRPQAGPVVHATVLRCADGSIAPTMRRADGTPVGGVPAFLRVQAI